LPKKSPELTAAHRFLAGWLLATLALGQTVDSTQVLSKILDRVHAGDRSLTRYVCRQRIVRRFWVAGHSQRTPCEVMAGSAEASRGMKLARVDRAALDVMVTQKSEMFSWPDAAQFDATSPAQVLGSTGLSASGDFGAFLSGIFGESGVRFTYQGPVEAGLVRFRYEVPQSISGFEMRDSRGAGKVGYRGSFDADPHTGDLVRLDVESMGAPPESGLCDAWQEIRYLRQARGSDLMLPQQTTTAMFTVSGAYSENHTSYEACRQFGVESKLVEDDAGAEVKSAEPPAPPPPGTEFEIRLTTPVDSETAWAGDRIEGTLVSAVRDGENRVLVPDGTVFRGRVTRVEHDSEPSRAVLLGIGFTSVVLSGVSVPVSLVRAEPGATGLWAFRGRKKAVLAKGFASRWRVPTKEDELFVTPTR